MHKVNILDAQVSRWGNGAGLFIYPAMMSKFLFFKKKRGSKPEDSGIDVGRGRKTDVGE